MPPVDGLSRKEGETAMEKARTLLRDGPAAQPEGQAGR